MNSFCESFTNYLKECLGGSNDAPWHPMEIAYFGPGLYAIKGHVGDEARWEWDVFYDTTVWLLKNPDKKEEVPKFFQSRPFLGVIPTCRGLWNCKELDQVMQVVRKNLLAMTDAYAPDTLSARKITEEVLAQLAASEL